MKKVSILPLEGRKQPTKKAALLVARGKERQQQEEWLRKQQWKWREEKRGEEEKLLAVCLFLSFASSFCALKSEMP